MYDDIYNSNCDNNISLQINKNSLISRFKKALMDNVNIKY
jgi:hypothetical protein